MTDALSKLRELKGKWRRWAKRDCDPANGSAAAQQRGQLLANCADDLEALLPALEQQISALQKVRERELLALADKWEKASFGAYRSIELSRRYAKDLRAALGPEGEKR